MHDYDHELENPETKEKTTVYKWIHERASHEYIKNRTTVGEAGLHKMLDDAITAGKVIKTKIVEAVKEVVEAAEHVVHPTDTKETQ